MTSSENQDLQLSPDDVLEMKKRNFRVSKLESAINQALQQVEPQFIKQLDGILQNMGISPSISGDGTWLITTESSSRMALPMQYLQVGGSNWKYGFVSLSVKLKAHDLIQLMQTRVLSLWHNNPQSIQKIDLQSLISFLRNILSSHATIDGNLKTELQEAATKMHQLNTKVHQLHFVVFEGEEYEKLKLELQEILSMIGCSFTKTETQNLNSEVSDNSPLDDIRQTITQ